MGTSSKQWLDVELASEKLLGDGYVAYRRLFTVFLTDHLIDCTRAFDGDLNAYLVMAVVSGRFWRSEADAQRLDGESGDGWAGVSTPRIAELTGIPRETVRRKLHGLEKRGWVERADRSSWRLVVHAGKPVVEIELSPVIRRGAKRTLRLLTSVEALL